MAQKHGQFTDRSAKSLVQYGVRAERLISMQTDIRFFAASLE
jgi:hypothetical protein